MDLLVSIAVDAIAYGMILFIISIGLSVTMGLMRVVNLAHGAFAMIGGYIASYTVTGLGLGYGIATLAAVVGTVLIALPLEILIYRRIYNNPDPLVHVLLTIGIAFFIIGVCNYLLGPTMKDIPLPSALQGSVDLGFRVLPIHRVFAAASGAVVAGVLWFVFERTDFGVKLRAAVDDADMAAVLGVRTSTLFTLTFLLSAGLAGLGGVIGAELLPIEPYYALRYMVIFLVVVSVGGAGSVGGVLAASLLLGSVDTVGRYLIPEFGDFFFYAAVIVVALTFPNGLFGRAVDR